MAKKIRRAQKVEFPFLITFLIYTLYLIRVKHAEAGSKPRPVMSKLPPGFNQPVIQKKLQEKTRYQKNLRTVDIVVQNSTIEKKISEIISNDVYFSFLEGPLPNEKAFFAKMSQIEAMDRSLGSDENLDGLQEDECNFDYEDEATDEKDESYDDSEDDNSSDDATAILTQRTLGRKTNTDTSRRQRSNKGRGFGRGGGRGGRGPNSDVNEPIGAKQKQKKTDPSTILKKQSTDKITTLGSKKSINSAQTSILSTMTVLTKQSPTKEIPLLKKHPTKSPIHHQNPNLILPTLTTTNSSVPHAPRASGIIQTPTEQQEETQKTYTYRIQYRRKVPSGNADAVDLIKNLMARLMQYDQTVQMLPYNSNCKANPITTSKDIPSEVEDFKMYVPTSTINNNSKVLKMQFCISSNMPL